ncbi:hypothetical protein V6C27_12060 [Peptococcaceae bacterium 1198_IL3148]
MGWSTVEWPPKNGSNIKPTPKLHQKLKKIIFICLGVIVMFAVLLGLGALYTSNNLSFDKVTEKIELMQKNIYHYYQTLFGNLME